MATAQGYGKIVTSGSVFAYDVGDTRNSYIGEPTVNLVPNADTMANWGSYSAGNDGTFITEFGTTGYRVRNKNTWNGIARGITLPTPGTYTISAWFRIWGKSPSNNGINVYTSGGGISDTAQGGDDTRIGEWQRISMTRTYTTTSLTFFIISWGGTSGVDWSSWDVTKPQVELKSHVTPFVAGTRSATQGLLPLVGNSTIDLSNISFNSNAQMVFDGTDDRIVTSIPNLPTGASPRTVTAVVRIVGTSSHYYGIVGYGASSAARTFDLGFREDNDTVFLDIYGAGGIPSVNSITRNEWFTITGVYTGTQLQLYLNGELEASNTYAINTASSNFLIGDTAWGYPLHMNGDISSVKIYNRALTAQEVKQNYRHYKTRFNLS